MFVRCSRVRLMAKCCDTPLISVASPMHPICRNAPSVANSDGAFPKVVSAISTVIDLKLALKEPL